MHVILHILIRDIIIILRNGNYMKKIFCIFACFVMFSGIVFAETEAETILNDMQIQNRISDIGFKLLNSNKIDVRMAFVYDKKTSKTPIEASLTRRQIVVYKDYIKFASDDAEIAAFLAREICKTAESYSGLMKGFVSSAQIKLAPKKYEILFDKRAVDFMVKAGYNPLALITFINKSYPQKRIDRFSHHNLTSKRLANIYEYIYFQYPAFLKDNEYLTNESYQHFLLSSIENRRKLQEKIETGSRENIKYE